MLSDDGLIEERPNLGGVQRIYRFGDMGLSMVNARRLHDFPYAWEGAVVKFDAKGFELDYSTELTSDVEVFSTDAEANEFIAKAKSLFAK